jgi:hypothetical protein
MGLVTRRVQTLLARGRLNPQACRQSMRARGEGSARLQPLNTLLGVRPHALASGLFTPRGEKAWPRPGVFLSSASRPYPERRLSPLLPRVARAVSPLVDIPRWWRRADLVHELQDRHYATLET